METRHDVSLRSAIPFRNDFGHLCAVAANDDRPGQEMDAVGGTDKVTRGNNKSVFQANKDSSAARRKILVAEDEALIAMDLKARLENLGYEVPDIATGAEAAIRLAGSYTPDLVLMDIGLDGKNDGIEAAAAIRHQLNIPVIFLTSHADSETMDRARLSEPFGYVVKPFGSINFRAIIEVAIQNHANE